MPCFPSLARAEKKLLRLAGEAGQFIPAGFDCGYSSARNSTSLNFFNSFFHAGLNPPKYKLTHQIRMS